MVPPGHTDLGSYLPRLLLRHPEASSVPLSPSDSHSVEPLCKEELPSSSVCVAPGVYFILSDDHPASLFPAPHVYDLPSGPCALNGPSMRCLPECSHLMPLGAPGTHLSCTSHGFLLWNHLQNVVLDMPAVYPFGGQS